MSTVSSTILLYHSTQADHIPCPRASRIPLRPLQTTRRPSPSCTAPLSLSLSSPSSSSQSSCFCVVSLSETMPRGPSLNLCAPSEYKSSCTRVQRGSRSSHPRERSPELPNGLFNWIGKFNKIPDSYVLNHHSLDGFLLLRYLKIASAICLVGCFITMPILLPINITGGGPNKELNLLAFGNVVDKNRYYAHAFVTWIFCSTCSAMSVLTQAHLLITRYP